MLSNINIFIDNLLNCNNDLDLIFVRLCDKFAPDESNNINRIKFVLASRFNYYSDEQKEEIKKLCVERDRQNEFRQNLILRDKKCLITGDNENICEACHIVPYSETKSFDISNGILLNRCFHKMFDDYLFSINPQNNTLVFSTNILECEYYHNYIKYTNMIIDIPTECTKYICAHYEKFLSSNQMLLQV